jgi:hypothetical protein
MSCAGIGSTSTGGRPATRLVSRDGRLREVMKRHYATRSSGVQQQPSPGQEGREGYLSHLPGHLRVLACPARREPVQGATAPRPLDPDDNPEIRQARTRRGRGRGGGGLGSTRNRKGSVNEATAPRTRSCSAVPRAPLRFSFGQFLKPGKEFPSIDQLNARRDNLLQQGIAFDLGREIRRR